MLTDAQIEFYRTNGYILLDDVYTPEEIEECSREYNALFERKQNVYNLEATWGGDWNDAEKESQPTSVFFSVALANFRFYVS